MKVPLRSLFPSWVCILLMSIHLFSPHVSLWVLISEPRPAKGSRHGLDPQRHRPDLHIWRHRHHRQRGVRQQGGCRRGVGLERKRKEERQHVRGGPGAGAGLPRAGAADPRHTPGFPHGGSHLTSPPRPYQPLSLAWPSPAPFCHQFSPLSHGQSARRFRDETDLRYGIWQEGKGSSWPVAPSKPGEQSSGSISSSLDKKFIPKKTQCPCGVEGKEEEKKNLAAASQTVFSAEED